jgi:hypothetical protein
VDPRWNALRSLATNDAVDAPVQQTKQKRRSGGKSR